MGFARARVADGDEVGAGLDPIPCRQGLDPGPGHPGQGLEVEGGHGLSTGQLGLLEVAVDAACIALGQFELGQGGEEARGGPTLCICAFGQHLPMALEAGQAQRVEHGG